MRRPVHLVAALVVAMLLGVAIVPIFKVAAAPLRLGVSPTLGASASYSVLAGTTVTCTGLTTTNGDVGVAPGTSITGFPSPCVAGPPGTTHSNDASAIAAQADNLAVFGVLDQTCDQTFGAVDLSAIFPAGVGPGVYCSTSSFSLSGNLNLTGSGVWIFKTVSTLITSPGASVTGGDPCNVWWRVGSSATVDTNTSFIGSIFALTDINLLTGASLNGRALAQTGQVVLQGNSIFGPVCVDTAPTSTSAPATSTSAPATSTSAPATSTSAPATSTSAPATSTSAPATSTSAPATGTSAAATSVAGTSTSAAATGTSAAPPATSSRGALAVVGLPATGGAPLQRGNFSGVLALVAGGLSAMALGLGVRAHRRRAR